MCCPSPCHRIFRVDFEGATYKLASGLVFSAFHAEYQWNSQKQESGCAIPFPLLRFPFDEQNDWVYAADDAGGDKFVQLMQLAHCKIEAFAPNRPCMIGKFHQANFDMQLLAVARNRPVNEIIEVHT